MNNFSNFIKDSQKMYEAAAVTMTPADLDEYIQKVGKGLSKTLQSVLYVSKKLNLMSKSDIEFIRSAPKSNLQTLYNNVYKNRITYQEFEAFWNDLRGLKLQINALPQYMTPNQRVAVVSGKMNVEDLIIDLDTPQGRNAAAKQYAPLIHKIVNQYVNRTSLPKSDILSAAMTGFVDAMNDYGKNKEGKQTLFITYASYRIQQAILNEITKYGPKNDLTSSLDNILTDIEKYSPLAVDDSMVNDLKSELKNWDNLYKLIEANFKQRDCDIFYRYFGINGYKKEKSKDIARSLGMSEGNIRNSVINKMLAFLKRDKRALEILQELRDSYNESLIYELIGCERDYVIETLLNDDIFIMLEELTRWGDKNTFETSIKNALKQFDSSTKKKLLDIIKSDFNYLDNNYKNNKKILILFLSKLYPTENISRKTDVSILEYMSEIQELYSKYGLKL